MSKRQSGGRVKSNGKPQPTKRTRRSGNVDIDWDEHSNSGLSSEDEAPAKRKQQDDEERKKVKESAEQVRVRMARSLLDKIEVAEAYHHDSGSEEEGENSDSDDGNVTKLDAVSKKLHLDLLKSEGRLKRPVAANLDMSQITQTVCSRAHRFAITCLALSDAEDFCFTGSKDCNIMKWDIETGKKLGVIKGKRNGDAQTQHTDQILALALSSDGRYLASGGKDKILRIWDCRTNSLIDSFYGHRDSISGLAFRKGTHTLYSSSLDRSVRAWNIDEMAFIESLFGHQAEIHAIDCLYKERAVTCSGDKTMRYWKIPEESQLVLGGKHMASIDAVKMIDETTFISGSQDGTLAMWTTTKKKPCGIIRETHGKTWVSAVAALPNSDLVASGGADGYVRLWRVDPHSQSLNTPEVGQLEVPGFVNALAFSSSGRVLVAGAGEEHRLGSWERDHKASNRLHIFRLPAAEEEQ